MNFSQIEFIFALLIVFQVKHFFGDYVFQTGWMVRGKGRAGLDFIIPLSVHGLVHASLTLLILIFVNRELWYLAVFDFAVHIVMDRIKAGPRFFGRFTDTNKSSFWIPLGLDQMVHHFTSYLMIWWLMVHH